MTNASETPKEFQSPDDNRDDAEMSEAHNDEDDMDTESNPNLNQSRILDYCYRQSIIFPL